MLSKSHRFLLQRLCGPKAKEIKRRLNIHKVVFLNALQNQIHGGRETPVINITSLDENQSESWCLRVLPGRGKSLLLTWALQSNLWKSWNCYTRTENLTPSQHNCNDISKLISPGEKPEFCFPQERYWAPFSNDDTWKHSLKSQTTHRFLALICLSCMGVRNILKGFSLVNRGGLSPGVFLSKPNRHLPPWWDKSGCTLRPLTSIRASEIQKLGLEDTLVGHLVILSHRRI